MNKRAIKVNNHYMRSGFARFVDALLLSALMSLAAFIILRTLLDLRLSIILAIIIGIIALRCIIYFQNKRYHDLNIKLDEQNNVELNNFELRKLSPLYRYDFFKKLLSSENPKSLKEGLILNNEILFLIFVDSPSLLINDLFLANFIASENKDIKEIIIVCNAVSSEVASYSLKFAFPFTFYTPLETYAIMKKRNYFLARFKKTQKHLSFRLKNHVFLKKQAKNFFRVGFLLYLACLFVPFVKSYVIMASVCLLMGIICLIFGRSDAPIKSYGKQLLNA